MTPWPLSAPGQPSGTRIPQPQYQNGGGVGAASSERMRVDPFELVRVGYDTLGPRYSLRYSRGGIRLEFLRRLQAKLPAGSRIVDLGCGPGDPTTRLLSAHHRVIGVDASKVQIELARQAVPNAEFVIADLRRFSLRVGCLDAVVCLYALGHVPAEDHRDVLRSIADWLRPGGLLLANTPSGAGASIAEDWLGVPMFFDGIGEEQTFTAVVEAGLNLESAERVVDEDGGEFVWIFGTAGERSRTATSRS